MERRRVLGTYLFDGFDIQGVDVLISELIEKNLGWEPVYFSNIETSVTSSINQRVLIDYGAFSIPDFDLMILPDGKFNQGFLAQGILARKISEHLDAGKKILAIGQGIKILSQFTGSIKVVARDMLALEIGFINESIYIDMESDICIDENVCSVRTSSLTADNIEKIIEWL